MYEHGAHQGGAGAQSYGCMVRCHNMRPSNRGSMVEVDICPKATDGLDTGKFHSPDVSRSGSSPDRILYQFAPVTQSVQSVTLTR